MLTLIMTTPTRYHSVSKLLHWTIAGLIVLQYLIANLAELAEDADQSLRELALLANHKSVGITVLMLAFARLGWRLLKSPPPFPSTMPAWQKRSSHVSHWAMYGLIFLLPVTGWLMSSATAYSVSWFNLVALPDFVTPDAQMAEFWEDTHEILTKLLLVVVGIHVLAALKHHFIDKDDILKRMLSRVSGVLFIGIIVAGAAWLGSAGSRSDDTATPAPAPQPRDPDPVVITASSLPAWQIDTRNSYIRFTGDQAGAEFAGNWEQWAADIRFDSDQLDESSFDVTINTAYVDTEDEDRDTTLMDAEWFDTDNYPHAYYRATSFAPRDEGGFTAAGQLIIKGRMAPVTLAFTVTTDDDKRLLIGSAQLRRLDLGVGTGEWDDTTWVSNAVGVEVQIAASIRSE